MRRIIFLIISCLSVVLAYGQIAIDSAKYDSIQQRLNSLNEQLDTYEQLFLQNNQRRKQDSLARIDLMKRIQLLQESGELNQATLKEQIREIEKRDSTRNAEQRNRIQKLKSTNQGYLVAPNGDSLFMIYTKLGPVIPSDRAANVSDKIELLVRDDFFYPDSLYLEENEGSIDIMYGNLIVTSITEWDALWIESNSQKALSDKYLASIKSYVTNKRNRSTIQNIAARIGLVFLVIGGVILVLYFLGKLTSGIQGWMHSNRKKYFTGLRIRSYEFLPPDLHLDASLKIVTLLKWALYILVFYFSLPLIFGLFPFTKGWAKTLMDWILSPARDIWFSFWNYIPNVFTIAIIYLVTRYLVKLIKFLAQEVNNGRLTIPGFYSDWAIPTYRLVKIMIYAFMLVMIWPNLPGSESDVFKGVAIFLGILISLGSTSAVGNAVAGLVITYMRPYRIGDQVKIGEIVGEVIEKTLLVTRIRTIKNEDITVPNSAILSGHTVNYTSSSKDLGLVIHTSVTISYDVPWRKVHELLIDAAIATEGVNVSKEPFVLQTSLDDWYVSYQLNAYTDAPHLTSKIYSELHGNIQDKFNEANVEITAPPYRTIRDDNGKTITKKH